MLLDSTFAADSQTQSEIGREAAIAHHLQDGEEFDTPLTGLIAYGQKLFTAHFTREEGAGRPLTKGTGVALSDPNSPLTFPRNNNRISGPESNSCSGCHNQPIAGGAGDLSSNRRINGTWNASGVEGLSPQSTTSPDAQHPPSLLILPFSQAGATVSLRVFTVNAFNQHHGMQATERFGIGTDPDGDGVVNELTRADITASTVFQATLPVPLRPIPSDPVLHRAIRDGEHLFQQIGCPGCHIPALPLDRNGWIYTEPNSYNPTGNLEPGEAPALSIDLASDELPQPRLKPVNGVVMVPLYTDFKLHDICSGPSDPNREGLNQNAAAGSTEFFSGNTKFLTKRLWAVGSKPNYFHHGQFTTIREAILNHFGEALCTQQAFSALSPYQQGAVIEFLKTLTIVAR